MKRSDILVIVCMAAALSVLLTLGTWQVQRLYWKEALIERVQNRLSSQPVSLTELENAGLNKSEHEYLPVTVSGIFDHDKEVYFFTTGKGGASGWNVHTPLKLEDGRNVIINRGFVPFDRKDTSTRAEGQVTGPQQITGLLRFPLLEKPFGTFENALATREILLAKLCQRWLLLWGHLKANFCP